MDGEDLSADALSRLWRARKTLAQMLADREYMVLEEDQALTFDEFKERFGVGSGLRYRKVTWQALVEPFVSCASAFFCARIRPPALAARKTFIASTFFPGAIAGSA
jgi:hypothetical protein